MKALMNRAKLSIYSPCFFLFALLSFSVSSFSLANSSRRCNIEGITYEITLLSVPNSNYVTVVSVDDTVTVANIKSHVDGYRVTDIDNYAFDGRESLIQVEIPYTVDNIRSRFKGCTSLLQINVDLHNMNYNSIDGVLFRSNSILAVPKGRAGVYIVPAFVTSIGDNAFCGCKSLTQIRIPSTVNFIGESAFSLCTSIKSITIPCIDNNIRDGILSGCLNLRYIFSYASITNNRFNPFEGISSSVTIFCLGNYIPVYKKLFSGTVLDININLFKNLATQGKILIEDMISNNDIHIKQTYRLTDNNDTIYADKNGRLYELKNLMPGKNYNIGIDLRFSDCDLTIFPPLSTKAIGLVCNSYTQTKLNLNIEADDVLVSESSLKYRAVGEWEWKYLDNVASSEITLSGLIPGMTYECYASVCINNNWYLSITGYNYQKFATRKLSLNISKPVIGQTVFSCSATFTAGDATVEGYGFTGAGANGEYDNTTELKSAGLDPNTEYKVVFRIKTKEGGVTSTGYTFTTLPILLTTLPADACSYVTATIHANMNCDAESGTGFEWRKMDAPNIVPSNFVEAPIVNEKMAFSLRNLTPSTYYKYRPYYKSNSGKYCYGEWIGFSTADVFVLYTPTVETLKVAAVEGNTVTFHGYVIAGSEDILQQGFEYWKADNNGYIRNSEVYKTVLASGLKMVAAAEGLNYNSTYYYRAFAKTASGITYGEDMNFKTEEITGLENITGTDAFNVALRSNPVYRQAWIRINGKNEHATYYLINLNGSMVDSGEIIADDSWQVIDLSHRTSGVYLLRINNERHSKTLKLIIK